MTDAAIISGRIYQFYNGEDGEGKIVRRKINTTLVKGPLIGHVLQLDGTVTLGAEVVHEPSDDLKPGSPFEHSNPEARKKIGEIVQRLGDIATPVEREEIVNGLLDPKVSDVSALYYVQQIEKSIYRETA